MDPVNPSILYASFWNVKRTPYSLESGGPGSLSGKQRMVAIHGPTSPKMKGCPKVRWE
ncbi:MAG: hypothetical protein IPM91_18210 [Bacteroidetes bacterium]|nr:hypothetical protein [Bacteroidota bacterium]